MKLKIITKSKYLHKKSIRNVCNHQKSKDGENERKVQEKIAGNYQNLNISGNFNNYLVNFSIFSILVAHLVILTDYQEIFAVLIIIWLILATLSFSCHLYIHLF